MLVGQIDCCLMTYSAYAAQWEDGGDRSAAGEVIDHVCSGSGSARSAKPRGHARAVAEQWLQLHPEQQQRFDGNSRLAVENFGQMLMGRAAIFNTFKDKARLNALFSRRACELRGADWRTGHIDKGCCLSGKCAELFAGEPALQVCVVAGRGRKRKASHGAASGSADNSDRTSTPRTAARDGPEGKRNSCMVTLERCAEPLACISQECYMLYPLHNGHTDRSAKPRIAALRWAWGHSAQVPVARGPREPWRCIFSNFTVHFLDMLPALRLFNKRS